jgi:sugar lactone lactonase YvrE
LEFLYVFENTRDAPYYPINGIGGIAYAADGTLIFSDEKGGRVHGLDPRTQEWYLFEVAPDRPFRPVDVQVDGFSVLVLDIGSRMLLRYKMNGSFQDRLVNFQYVDPAIPRLPTSFDIDRDGRIVVTDVAESQVLVLDPFLTLIQIVGEAGSHHEQLEEPSGIVFLPDGGYVVADRDNRRLQRFNRLGYFESIAGGEFDLQNPMVAPQGVDCDAYGNVFLADPPMGAVHVFSRSLRHMFTLGSEAGLLAAPEIPLDVAVGPDDLLAVTDRGRQAVLVFRIHYE